MGHIFISYSHKDKEYVHKLADAMQSEGFEIWIDDRIDYGTRWPLVIETAIDTCDAFILIASDNSHTSEWVQHEFVRAQRLRKPLYPILINGNPWVSFESTQYFDARDGLLPSQKFYSVLRNNWNLHLKYIKGMAIENWPIYINKKYGFSVNFPLGGEILNEYNDFVHINLPVPEGTNLKDKNIKIHYNESGILSSPLHNSLSPFESRNIEILGQRFLMQSDSEGAAGTFGKWTSYTTSRGNKIISLSLTLVTTSYQAYLPQLLPRIDLVAEAEALIYSLSTFTWLD